MAGRAGSAVLLGLLLTALLLIPACASGVIPVHETETKESGTSGAQTAGEGQDGAQTSGAQAGDTEGSMTELEVHFFQAGKADAILLTTKDSAVLIDAGEKGFGKTILAYLEERGIERIDCLIVTHFDQDHVGGAAKVINNITVGTVLQSNRPKDSEEYEKYVKALANAQIEPVTVREILTFTLDGVSYTVDPPRQTGYGSDNSNNSSLIVTARNGSDGFLFTGDARAERLSEYLDGGSVPCDVLKVPYHGRSTELLDDLIAAASPSWAVITSSEEQPEDEAVVELLQSAGITVLLTREGAATFRSSGSSVELLPNE